MSQNNHIRKALNNAILKNRITQAYIFEGEDTAEALSLAKDFAKTIQCEGETKPCNECISCVTFENQNHPDIRYLAPEKQNSIGVDDIRTLISDGVMVKPYRYGHKIFIIENAHTMTVQAQNAFLKTLEEPPFYAIFLLIAKTGSDFLKTIISRCVVFKLRALPVPAFLTSTQESDVSLVSHCISLCKSLETCSLVDIFGYVKELEAYKERIQDCLDVCIIWFRDLLTEPFTTSLLPNQNFQTSFTQNEILNAIERLSDAKKFLKQNANFQLTLELCLIKSRRR